MSIMNRINRKIKQAKKAMRKKFAERQGVEPFLDAELTKAGVPKEPQRKYMQKKRRGIDGTMRW